MTRTFAAAAFAALLATTTVSAVHAAPADTPAYIVAALMDPGRPAADHALDHFRQPGRTMTFVGIKPGMVVAELNPGGGYYTRMLSKAVGPNGKVFALISKAQSMRPNGMDGINAIAAAYPNVTVVVADFAAIMLPQKVDLFWTTENYHDFHNGPTANVPALDKSVYDNLKPNGVFYVEDHSAAPGAGLAVTSTLHRMDEAVAKTELTAAGFKIAAENESLRNPMDDRTKPQTTPGHFQTDRFALRLTK